VREAVAFALLACACGAALHQPAATKAALGPEAAPAPMPSASNAEAMAAFDALAARGQALAAGMREVARKESDGERVEIARADKRDACVRVAFESTAPVVAKLVDREGRVLAASKEPTTEGVLGERGPVCVRKGDVVACLADGAPAHVRWVAWEAP
jgi:hypothetical protein